MLQWWQVILLEIQLDIDGNGAIMSLSANLRWPPVQVSVACRLCFTKCFYWDAYLV